MRFHRKYIIRAVILLPVLLGVIYFWYRVPWEFHKEFEGIYYKLGDPYFSEKVTIRFDGYLQRGVWQEDVFDGKLQIGVKEMHVILHIPEDGPTALMYQFNSILGMYGFLYTKDIKKGFTILVFENDDTEANNSSQSARDWYMISAPADNRSEAMELSKKFADPILLEGSK